MVQPNDHGAANHWRYCCNTTEIPVEERVVQLMLDMFNVQGVYTRREPLINVTIQSMTVLQAASEQLARTTSYQH